MSVLNLAKILALSFLLAGGSAWLRAAREPARPEGATGVVVPAPGIPLIRLSEAKWLFPEKGTLFLDVRSANDYAYGHISGALSLPYEDFDKRLPELKPELEKAAVLVVYCKNEDCGKSLWAAQELWNAGLKQVRIYPGGWNEWSLRGLPTHATATR